MNGYLSALAKGHGEKTWLVKVETCTTLSRRVLPVQWGGRGRILLSTVPIASRIAQGLAVCYSSLMESTQLQNYNKHNIATVSHDAGHKKIVIFCHGYRSSTIGPNRFFVRAARKLADHGISSLRFDQYGSGNSEGDFYDSSFNDWVATTKAIVEEYTNRGYAVALFGQSMGGSTVLAAAADLGSLRAIVSWVPDASVDDFHAPESGVIEEGGQIVRSSYWQEAHDARVGDRLPDIKVPAYIVQCTADEYVDQANREKLIKNALPQHTIENFEGYKHSSWTYEQSEDIIVKSVDFLVKHLGN